jgi:iron complex transport system substrate-binding protein
MKILLVLIFICSNTASALPRYISIAPATTEILFALGLDEEIVGVGTFCNYPAKAKDKPKVGDFSHPNMEKIFSLKPDYIFSTGLEQDIIVTQLRQLKFNVYVSDPPSVGSIFSTITDIGRLTGKSVEAGQLIKKMKADIESVSARVRLVPQDKRPRVFIEIWSEPLMTAGKGSFVDELVTMAGGINIAHDTRRPYSIFSSEMAVNRNPGYIFMTYMDKSSPLELVEKRFGWKSVDAVKNKKVFNDISSDVMLRPGPRVVEALKEMNRRLYP